MRRLDTTKAQTLAVVQASTSLIAVGLVILIAAMIVRDVPIATAMALIALGATGATVPRFLHSRLLPAALLLHLTIYGGLYSLCIGATLDAASRTGAGLTALASVDLLLSIGPVAATLALTVNALRLWVPAD
jgi:hypothetical protein